MPMFFQEPTSTSPDSTVTGFTTHMALNSSHHRRHYASGLKAIGDEARQPHSSHRRRGIRLHAQCTFRTADEKTGSCGLAYAGILKLRFCGPLIALAGYALKLHIDDIISLPEHVRHVRLIHGLTCTALACSAITGKRAWACLERARPRKLRRLFVILRCCLLAACARRLPIGAGLPWRAGAPRLKMSKPGEQDS